MTTTSRSHHERIEDERGSRYIVVAADSHAGPSLERQLREYCPSKYLDEFDEHARLVRASQEEAKRGVAIGGVPSDVHDPEAAARTKACTGLQDLDARHADMDAEGVAADVIFAGGQNDEPLPFLGMGLGAGAPGYTDELRNLGCRIWNAWLADWVSAAPERHVGTIQIPIWDVDAAVREIEWARGAGLTAVNFPAPRPDFRPYNDPVYEPMWSAVVDLDLPLLTHSAGGELPLGVTGPGATSRLFNAEVHFMSRRGLWEMIFGRVFQRHPQIRMVFTETRVKWVTEIVPELDSIHYMEDHRADDILPKAPSEYFAENCFVCGSFMAPFESALHEQVGLRNLMWGSDYPHAEGTWPRTGLTLRNTFSALPEDRVRMILGENAIPVYNLDRAALREIADRIGPRPEDLASPLADDEFPAHRGFAFRTRGNYS